MPLAEVYQEISEIVTAHSYREIPVKFSQLKWHMTLERLNVGAAQFSLSSLGESQLAERIGIGNLRKFLSEKTLLDVNAEINQFLKGSDKSVILLERGGMIHGVATKRPEAGPYRTLLEGMIKENDRPVRLTISDREMTVHVINHFLEGREGLADWYSGSTWTTSEVGRVGTRRGFLLFYKPLGFSLIPEYPGDRSMSDLAHTAETFKGIPLHRPPFFQWLKDKGISQTGLTQVQERLETLDGKKFDGLAALGLESINPQNAPMTQLQFEKLAKEWLLNG